MTTRPPDSKRFLGQGATGHVAVEILRLIEGAGNLEKIDDVLGSSTYWHTRTSSSFGIMDSKGKLMRVVVIKEDG